MYLSAMLATTGFTKQVLIDISINGTESTEALADNGSTNSFISLNCANIKKTFYYPSNRRCGDGRYTKVNNFGYK